MGSVCCVAARDRTVLNRNGNETLQRNLTCSPSWSVRWENRRRVAGEIDDSTYLVSHGASRNVSIEMKGAVSFDRVDLSDHGSPFENFATPTSVKSPFHTEISGSVMTPASDISTASNYSAEGKISVESPDVASSVPKMSYSMSSTYSPPITNPLYAHSPLYPPNSTPPLRYAQPSPVNRLLRQVSDSRILGMKSPNDHSISEGRSSFLLSTCSNDLTAGSHGGCSDGWSMRTFAELVATSQRDRWSFDSEHFGFGHGEVSGCSSPFSYSSSTNAHFCGACSNTLTERCTWSSQRLTSNNELPVVSVLVCGHAYHADCLEAMTSEAEKYDPVCPICCFGEKRVSKTSRKASKMEAELKAKSLKMFRSRVVDSSFGVDGGSEDLDHLCCHTGKRTPKLEPSSSRGGGSSAYPLLRRHFSIGSKWGRFSENNCTRKKGFWARYRKE